MSLLAVTPGQAWGTWRTVSEVSPRVIIDEAAKDVTLAVVGSDESVAWLREQLAGADATEADHARIATRVKGMSHPPSFESAGFFPFTLYVNGPNEPIGLRGKNSVPYAGSLTECFSWMLRARPDLSIAFSRAYPAMRGMACEMLIQRASKANAQIAFLSSLPKLLPVPLPFLPISSLADVILLTKNQAMLIMRLAAAFGQRPGYDRQVKELLGTVAAALGWRTLARELVDFVPLGVGAALKASIAYSGTVAVGKAALFYYTTGKKPTAEQIRAFEKQAKAESESVATQLEVGETAPVEEVVKRG